jgi:hypothetical protein
MKTTFCLFLFIIPQFSLSRVSNVTEPKLSIKLVTYDRSDLYDLVAPEKPLCLQVMQVVEMAILATDLASYFDKRQKFLSIADAGEIDWQVGLGISTVYSLVTALNLYII